VRYSPKLPDDSVNISPKNVLSEILKLLGGISVVLLIVYFVLGAAAALIAPRISPGLEERIGQSITSKMCVNQNAAESRRLQELLDRFTPFLAPIDSRLTYTVWVEKSDLINAAALPGGTVIVYEGLLHHLESEDELLFVLGHEMGHFHHRDHLARLGRSLVLYLISTFFSFSGHDSAGFIMDTAGILELSYSRTQERRADLFGLKLLRLSGGDPEAAVKVMERFGADERNGRFRYFFATHPHPEDRTAYIRRAVNEITAESLP